MSSLLESWLNEDSVLNDVTTHLIGSNKNAKFIVTGGPGVLSGLSIANHLMSEEDLTCNFLKSDGEIISCNENVAYISGDFNFILSRERLFLNLLSHLSGISTLTREIVDIVNSKNPNTFKLTNVISISGAVFPYNSRGKSYASINTVPEKYLDFYCSEALDTKSCNLLKSQLLKCKKADSRIKLNSDLTASDKN